MSFFLVSRAYIWKMELVLHFYFTNWANSFLRPAAFFNFRWVWKNGGRGENALIFDVT